LGHFVGQRGHNFPGWRGKPEAAIISHLPSGSKTFWIGMIRL
jgi:hypothetical protein